MSIVIRKGKLSGAPHVEGTRITVGVLQALHRRGYTMPQILEMYPDITQADLALAIMWPRKAEL